MNAVTLRSRYGREPVSAYIDEGWSLMPLKVGGVPFHRVGRYAITVGAPLGPQEDSAAATSAFRQHCRSKGWRPVIFQVASPVAGLRSHLIAREAFIDVGDFSLSGSAMANARHSVTRARRDGMTVSWRRWSECDTESRAEMRLISESWCGGRPELTFTYGRLSDIPNDAWVGLAIAAGGRIEALSTWRPLPAGPGMVLDLMRRRKDSTPGAVELMIVEAVGLARSESLAWLSLGSISQSEDLPRWLRLAMASAAACGGSGLSSFKGKFHPRWEDRYLALPARTAAIAGLLALAIAHVRGARVRPKRASKTQLRRPAYRWCAAAGMTAGLCALGMGGATHDIGRLVVSPLQMSMSLAAEKLDPGANAEAPMRSAHVSPAPLAVRLPVDPGPAPPSAQAMSQSETTDGPGTAAADPITSAPRRSAASLQSTALCAPTAAVHVSQPGAPLPKASPATTAPSPGSRCGIAIKQTLAAPKPIPAPTHQPASAPTHQPTSAPTHQPTPVPTRQPTPSPASK